MIEEQHLSPILVPPRLTDLWGIRKYYESSLFALHPAQSGATGCTAPVADGLPVCCRHVVVNQSSGNINYQPSNGVAYSITEVYAVELSPYGFSGAQPTTYRPQSPVSPITYTLYSTPRSLCAVYLLCPHICPSRAALPVPAYAAAGPGRHVARPSGSITRQSLRL